MPTDRKWKKRVRAYAAERGMSYLAALNQMRAMGLDRNWHTFDPEARAAFDRAGGNK